jgi:hypothetical protein
MNKPVIFKPTPKQIEAHNALKKNNIVLYGCAIRGAKSYWGCMELITLCFQYPKSRWLVLRESLPTLKRTLLVTFQSEFLDKGFSEYVTDFNQQSLTLTWNNGSQLIFMAESYDTDKELNRFKGLEINGAFLDEANELQENTFNKVIERSGSWFGSKGCPTKILMTANPSNNWLKERIYNHWQNNTLPKGVAYIPAKITDNPYIPAEYLESLKMLPRYQYEVFVEGNWDVQLKVGGEFYKCFELDKHIGVTKYNPLIPLHISWDDNVSPYLPMGIFQITDTYVQMIDEIAGIDPRNTVKDVCNEFKRMYPNHRAGLFVYGDATAKKEDTKMEKGHNFYRLIMDNLSEYNPRNRVLSSNPSVAMRGNFINSVLEKEIFGLKILIGEHCKKAINDFILTKEAADGTKHKETETNPTTKVRYQKVGHFSDLFDYMFVSAFNAQFIQYQRGSIIPKINVGKNIHKHSY